MSNQRRSCKDLPTSKLCLDIVLNPTHLLFWHRVDYARERAERKQSKHIHFHLMCWTQGLQHRSKYYEDEHQFIDKVPMHTHIGMLNLPINDNATFSALGPQAHDLGYRPVTEHGMLSGHPTRFCPMPDGLKPSTQAFVVDRRYRSNVGRR